MGELLKSLSENPDQIADYTREQIEEARQALTEFTAQVKAGEVPDIDSDAISEAVALASKLAEREQALDADDEARQAEIAKLDEALGITAEEVEEIVAEEAGPEDEEEENGEDEEASTDEKVVVTASAPTLGQIARLRPRQAEPVDEDEGSVIIASAGVNMGRPLDVQSYGELMEFALRSGGEQRFAQAKTKHKYEVRKGDEAHNMRVLDAVARDARDDILTAAGGICAPAEVLYTFFSIADRSAGILRLPTVGAPRGAISLPVSPSLGDFLGEPGIATEWTAENDADPSPSPATKAVYTFDCPDFQDCTVSAWPTIVQVGNFAARFFPEAIQNLNMNVAIAADRTLNAARIAFLLANDVAGNVTDTGGGGLNQLATNLAGNANDYRATYGMSRDAVLDVVLPAWVPDALLADAIARDSTTEYGDIRGKVDGLFNSLRLRPQWVYDLDDQADGDLENVATVIMFAPGTVVELDGGTLDLGVVRDSTLNSLNNFQTFVEPFVGWCVPGHEIRTIEVEVCPSGATGDRVTIQCANNS